MDEVSSLKAIMGVESFETMRRRKLARARKLDKREHIAARRRIYFETPEALLACIPPQRLRLCKAARKKPRSISDLANALPRDLKAVHRDVKVLYTAAILSVRREINPSHGQVNLVEATALRFHLTAEM